MKWTNIACALLFSASTISHALEKKTACLIDDKQITEIAKKSVESSISDLNMQSEISEKFFASFKTPLQQAYNKICYTHPVRQIPEDLKKQCHEHCLLPNSAIDAKWKQTKCEAICDYLRKKISELLSNCLDDKMLCRSKNSTSPKSDDPFSRLMTPSAQ